MTDASTSLARRLVACKHFRWMPGMADYECRIICIDGDTLHSGSRGDGGSDWHSARAMSPPDLADPATLGCIEHGLLPEAWDPDCFLFRGPLGWGWGKGATSFIETQPTKAEALVAALEAAPQG